MTFVEEMSGGTFFDMTVEDAWRFLVELADQDMAGPPTASVPDLGGDQCQSSVDTPVQQPLDQIAIPQDQSLQFQQISDAQMTEGPKLLSACSGEGQPQIDSGSGQDEQQPVRHPDFGLRPV